MNIPSNDSSAKVMSSHPATATMRESILLSQHSLEKLFQGLPESAIKPRACITIELEQLAAQLARVDQTLENVMSPPPVLAEVMSSTHAPAATMRESKGYVLERVSFINLSVI
jgi:hypothetical protein